MRATGHHIVLASLLLVLMANKALAQRQPVAITGGDIYTVSGDVLRDGTIVFHDGVITALGPTGGTAIPGDARRIDASGSWITPGFFDPATAMGLVEVDEESSTRDDAYNEDEVRAAFRAADGINPNTVLIPVTRSEGVTTVASVPTGGIISGQGTVIDLYGRALYDIATVGGEAMYGEFNPDLALGVGRSRGGVLLRLREVLDDTRLFMEDSVAYRNGALRDLTVSRLDLSAMARVLRGEIPLVMRVSRSSDIEAMLRLAVEYEVDLVIHGGEEAWMVADQLAQHNVPVVLKPFTNLPVAFDRLGSRADNAAILVNHGVTIAISVFYTHNARNLRFEAGRAVRYGLAWEHALEAVTLNPAKILGLDDVQGSLAVGMKANVVVWSGDPFEFSSHARHVFIRGQQVDLSNRQAMLFRRYRTLPGDSVATPN